MGVISKDESKTQSADSKGRILGFPEWLFYLIIILIIMWCYGYKTPSVPNK